ncbi:MAG: hypothetical protein ACM3TT_06620 [Syntrophothermus sp.]
MQRSKEQATTDRRSVMISRIAMLVSLLIMAGGGIGGLILGAYVADNAEKASSFGLLVILATAAALGLVRWIASVLQRRVAASAKPGS